MSDKVVEITRATELVRGKPYLIEIDTSQMTLEDVAAFKRALEDRAGIIAILVPAGMHARVIDAPDGLVRTIERIVGEHLKAHLLTADHGQRF